MEVTRKTTAAHARVDRTSPAFFAHCMAAHCSASSQIAVVFSKLLVNHFWSNIYFICQPGSAFVYNMQLQHLVKNVNLSSLCKNKLSMSKTQNIIRLVLPWLKHITRLLWSRKFTYYFFKTIGGKYSSRFVARLLSV